MAIYTASEYSGASSVQIQGLKEFRKALREVDKKWTRELTRANRDISKIAERVSQTQARSMGGVQAKAAGAIRGSATVRFARLQVKPSGSKRAGTAMANVAFYGAKKRTGWYATKREGKPQHPEWVGADWQVASAGEGPYAINAALARHMDDIIAAHMAALDRLAAEAFPQ